MPDFPKMDRLALILSPLPKPANEPDFAADLTRQSQKFMDEAYTRDLKGYFDRGDSHVETQVISRQNSPDPAAYHVAEFASKIPQRQVMLYTEGGAPTSDWLPPDPRIKPPVVPPYVAPGGNMQAPGGGFKAAAPVDQVIIQTVTLLFMQVNAKLDAILALLRERA